jgi:hypothetical protein
MEAFDPVKLAPPGVSSGALLVAGPARREPGVLPLVRRGARTVTQLGSSACATRVSCHPNRSDAKGGSTLVSGSRGVRSFSVIVVAQGGRVSQNAKELSRRIK